MGGKSSVAVDLLWVISFVILFLVFAFFLKFSLTPHKCNALSKFKIRDSIHRTIANVSKIDCISSVVDVLIP